MVHLPSRHGGIQEPNLSSGTIDPVANAREFDRQVGTLLERGYPELAGMDESAFVAQCEPLRVHLANLATPPVDVAAGRLPFVLVVSTQCVPAAEAMVRVVRAGRFGVVALSPAQVADFTAIPPVAIPTEPIYLMTDFGRGDDYRNETPENALRHILAAGRSPLILEEGIAVLTQAPEILVKNHCFSLLGSRRGDQRVPALWLSEGRPKLGWCWDRNPHTWLGSASCAARLGKQVPTSRRSTTSR